MTDADRIAALRRYEILDTDPEPEFDRIVELAARMFDASMSVLSFRDANRWWRKARFGTDQSELPASAGIVPTPISLGDTHVVLDMRQDATLRDHPLVAGPPYLRFYVSTPVRASDGQGLGVIVVADIRPREEVAAGNLAGIEALGRLAESELERRQISRHLQETAARYRDLAEVSSEWVWETDAEHRLTGLVADEPALKGLVHGAGGFRRWEFDGARPLHGTWADHMADLDARREFRSFEYEATVEAGRHRVFRISGRPRFDAEDRFLGYRGTGSDVTQRRTEELAHAVNQRLFETSADLILAMDRDGKYVLVSPSSTAVLGYTPQELIDSNGVQLVHPGDIELVRQEMRQARRGRTVRHFECRCITKDGRVVPVSVIDVWSEADEHHFFIARDMTEHKATQERQRQSQRLEAMGQLTGGIAHDFNNILGIVMLKLENALEEMPPDAPGRERVESALTAGSRGVDLVSRLLAFARKRPLEPTDVSVGALLGDLGDLLKAALRRGVSLSLEIADDLPPCRIDRSGLEAAILNLAVNARDAMPEGGRLTITARRRKITREAVAARPDLRLGRWVEITVRDTGTGMPPEVQARVFEPFFTTKGEGKGTGLGLAMVHGFVHQSGGFLTLDSRMGEGTTFTLYLPALAAEAPVPAGPPPDAVP
ncbi:MAG: PAS domain S-box protein [Alphaproteobacteria bacterium]|nr:PAS domain S-box protein [Alphaproteobacteria bacterium]